MKRSIVEMVVDVEQPETRERESGFERSSRLGRELLVPYILLLLSNYQMHGYLLLQRLTELGLAAFDPPTVYRTLRSMERDGLISSRWDTASDGPARRVYALTEAGTLMLGQWANALDTYQRTLSSFFDLYAGFGQATMDALGMSPAASSAPNEDDTTGTSRTDTMEPTERGSGDE